jgi:hypothetical protein
VSVSKFVRQCFVQGEKGICLEIALVELEASLVGNPDAIPEGRGAGVEITGHVMEQTMRKSPER